MPSVQPPLLCATRRMLALFLLYEVCIGVYSPAMGILRSKYIPDEMRATVMLMFRWASSPFPDLGAGCAS